jgi:Lon protease-like protein
MPMFPLGSVLFPSVFLPLHVFEERYRRLTQDCLAGDREFGVVLIERGSEVGGDDFRTDVGTVARIIEAAEFEDGRWALSTIGNRRIRVDRWLPDDPYPRAEVSDWPGDETAPGPDAPGLEDVTARLRQVLGKAAELGEALAPATLELSNDPSLATYQMAAVAPIGPLDRLRVLSTDGAADRMALVAELLSEADDLLEARLGFGGDENPLG